jgi:hypothetical protein
MRTVNACSASKTAHERIARVIGIVSLAATVLLPPIHAQTPSPSPDAQAIALLRGASLNDLARLLKPANLVVGSGPSSITLHLRDVIYRGASQNKARLLSLWTPAVGVADTPLLTDADSNAQEAVAERLTAVLSGSAFAVCLLDAQWRPWEVRITTSAPCATRGSFPTDDSSLRSSDVEIMRISTGAVTIPLGFGATRSTAWQVWFDSDTVTFRLYPSADVDVSQNQPARSLFGDMSGLSLPDTFLNSVFSNEFRSRLFGLGTAPTLTHRE